MNNSQNVVNYSNTASIHQKRTLTFINHFVLKTVQFLNNFAVQCETKLMNFEYKLQKVEASLIILETKLSSIPDVTSTATAPTVEKINEETTPITENKYEDKEEVVQQKQETESKQETQKNPEYEKYFKMIQVGVPIQAVRLKIIQEGLDPAVIDLYFSRNTISSTM